MSNTYPLISVLICNYNYEKYIEEALDSAVSQTYPNIEIVIIDDGSNDSSVSIVETFVSKQEKAGSKLNVTLIAKTKNQGLCYARNDAIDASKGEYFVFLDSDDTMPEEYVEKMYAHALKTKSDVVYGDVKRFGDDTSVSDEIEFSRDELLTHNFINISSLVKKSATTDQRFDLSLNKDSLEDYDFWLGLSLAGKKLTKIHDLYLNYRIQAASRNKNTSSLYDRHMDFLRTWSKIISKYKAIYPEVIDENVYYEQARFQVATLGHMSDDLRSELSTLNTTVQTELNPELKVREEYIQSQSDRIKLLEESNAQIRSEYEAVLNSTGYKIGSTILVVPKHVKSLAKRQQRNKK